MEDDFFLTNLELRESTETGEQASGLTHDSMKGMVLLSVLELAARGVPRGAITVLHDAGDCGDRYKDLAMVLAQDGWAVALPDLRGHGRTEGERGHSNGLLEVVRDVQEIQDHLAYRMPDEPKVLIGQGLGANYAVTYALERPDGVRALVLVAPLLDPPFEAPKKPGGLKGMFQKITPRSAGHTRYQSSDLTRDSAQASRWDGGEGVHRSITLRAIEEARRSAREHVQRLGQVSVPTLLLVGDADPFVDAAACQALAGERVQVEVLPGLRHHPLQEQGAQDVYQRIERFLNETLPQGS